MLDSLQSCLETRKVPAGSYSCWRRPHSLCLSCPGNLNSFSSSELYSDSFSTSPFCCSMCLCATNKSRNEHCCGPHSLPQETATTKQYLFLSAGCFSSSMARHSLWSFTVSQDATGLCIKLWLSLTERCGSGLGELPPAAHECLFSSLLPDSRKLLSDLSGFLHPSLGHLDLALYGNYLHWWNSWLVRKSHLAW